MPPVHPKKRMGQHFLTDTEAIASIVCAVQGADTVVEIGPGMGVLTRGLLERFGSRLHCLEVDREAVAYLRREFPTLGSNLHEGDCLRFDFSTLSGSMAWAGNLPYNISSQILFQLLDQRNRVAEAVFMLQREVATRIAEGPGSRDYGILSVLLQAWYSVEYLFTLPPEAFNPPPAVYSGVVRLTRNSTTALGCDFSLFTRVVKGAFNQRRKMLRKSLPGALGIPLPEIPYADKRPEQLGVPEFVALTCAVAEQLPKQ